VYFTIPLLSFSIDNLALNKHAIISSRAHFWSKPELANDGDSSQEEVKCTQTLTNATQAWWQANLGAVNILDIHITYAEKGWVHKISFKMGGGGTRKHLFKMRSPYAGNSLILDRLYVIDVFIVPFTA
jgi:hypothetical protein